MMSYLYYTTTIIIVFYKGVPNGKKECKEARERVAHSKYKVYFHFFYRGVLTYNEQTRIWIKGDLHQATKSVFFSAAPKKIILAAFSVISTIQ